MTRLFDRASLETLHASRPPREAFGPGGEHPLLLVESEAIGPQLEEWLRDLPCPVIGLGDAAPACDALACDLAAAERMAQVIRTAPIASMVLVQQLRLSEGLRPEHALTSESLAYATVQRGPEFLRWQASAPPHAPAQAGGDPVRIDTADTHIAIVMNRPEQHNAIDAAMRDALCEAFALAAELDLPVLLSGAGRCFSIGGAVEEFGTVSDPATAHWVRSLRLPATFVLPVAHRSTAHIQGAAIGAGVELAAFCHRVTASPGAWFQLPELRYGLIPGAGGTVSIPRRIGRQRAAEIMLSMRRIQASEALAIGLIDAICA
jgi:enoyl-CoA hydratase